MAKLSKDSQETLIEILIAVATIVLKRYGK